VRKSLADVPRRAHPEESITSDDDRVHTPRDERPLRGLRADPPRVGLEALWGPLTSQRSVLAFVIAEGAIGAGLVLGELVANDASEARAIVISLHLVNTLTLVGASALVAWWSQPRPTIERTLSLNTRWLWLVLIGLVVTSMSGAVTALGDTLFPVQAVPGVDLVDRLRDELSPGQHFLVRLRILHPVLACAVALLAGWVALTIQDTASGVTRRVARVALSCVVIQVILGFANIMLAAPGAMQLLHLLTAQLVWTCFLLLRVGVDNSPAHAQQG
jgi:cytochrome c oxidase assembly protein subunit 15